MNQAQLRDLLQKLWAGTCTPEEALSHFSPISQDPAEPSDLVLDWNREQRTGFPEAIYAAGKTPEQVIKAFSAFRERNGKALATRCSRETQNVLLSAFPDAQCHAQAGVVWWHKHPPASEHLAMVVAAGTSDLPVAEEAALTLEFAGIRTERIFDVGVAGIHRLFERLEAIRKADILIIAAGMEGALPSVVGGLVSIPMIAVPTSVGYGAGFQGLAALLAMLNSCAPGIPVMNIDNGFGAAVAAIRILQGRPS